MMRPLQVYLDERDLKSLEAWARERGWTKSQAIRAAVRAPSRRLALLTTHLVVAETHRLMLHLAGVQPALRTLESFDASTSLTVHIATADDHAGARRWLERLAPRPITYTDAVSFAVMEATRC